MRIYETGYGVTLVDGDTGFAIDLSDSDFEALIIPGPRSAIMRTHMDRFGLTGATSELIDVRRKQRKALAGEKSQVSRLRDRLDGLCRRVPYFGQRRANYDPALISSLEDFAQLPLMRRRDLRRSFPHDLLPNDIDLAAGIASGQLSFVATSGSTDERIQVLSSSMIDRLPFGSDDLFGISIGGRPPKTAFFTTPVCSTSACFRQDHSYRERRSKTSPDLLLRPASDPFTISADLVQAFFAEVAEFQPTILAADPIYLQGMVRAARKYDLPLPTVPIVQTGFEFRTQTSLRELRNAFHSPVLDDYGASEENRLAVECHRGCLHVRTDAIYLEIINKGGVCSPGTVGNVVITTFDTITPLVRYLIGDLASWTGRRCDCAFADWPTIEVHGRCKDLLSSQGRWISSLEIDRAVQAPEWLDFYRLTQTEPHSFNVEIVGALGAQLNLRHFVDTLTPYLDPKELHFRSVNGLELLPSLKVGTTLTKLETPEIVP